MRGFVVILISVMLLFFSFSTVRFGTGSQSFTVPIDFPTIQEAINNVADGDTVFVQNGTYFENVVINKTITLKGENVESTMIDGGGTGTVLNVTAKDVVVTGFTIRNGGSNMSQGGICLHRVIGCNVSENIITRNHCGIIILNSSDNLIYHNNFVNNTVHVDIKFLGYYNSLDFGYPSAGNYWDDYAGFDDFHGPGQDESGSDGIGDTSYSADIGNVDRYPLVFPYGTPPRVHNIDTGLGYLTVHLAIDAPETLDGHKILVDAGVYREHIILYKSLSISGEDTESSIIDGSGSGIVINVTATNASISGLTIRNGSYGILLGSSFVNVSENILANNNVDINLRGHNNVINRNHILNDYCAILLESSNSNIVEENEIFGQTIRTIGVELKYSNSNRIQGNNINYQYNGISLHSSFKNELLGNLLLATNHYGIVIRFSSKNKAAGNIIGGNYAGVVLDQSSENVVGGNAIEENTIGISVQYSFSNSIYYNNFAANAYQAVVHPNNYENYWNFEYSHDYYISGNYWDDYAGVDNDGNGIGDTPYVINSYNKDNYPHMQNVSITTKVDIHDVVVEEVWVSPSVVFEGQSVTIFVRVANEGNYTETFDVTVFYNDYALSTQGVPTLRHGARKSLTFVWSTSGLSANTSYLIRAVASIVPDETETGNNVFNYGAVWIHEYRDVVVEEVWVSPSVVFEGQSVTIFVRVANEGNYTETFNVTVSCSEVLIDSQTVDKLDPNLVRNLTFTWSTAALTPCSIYVVKANTSQIQGDAILENNAAEEIVKIRIMGDVNADDLVNILDLSAIAIAFGSKIGGPLYDSVIDLNQDEKINIIDIAAAAINFGRTCTRL